MSQKTELTSMVEEFRKSATRFMSVVESAEKVERSPFLEQLESALVELYEKALDLPDVEPGTDLEEKLPMNLGTQPIYDALLLRLQPVDRYWEVFDPTEYDQPVLASLSDAIIDTYKDVKKGVMIAGMGASPSEVLWLWQFSFISHWGYHAASAINALHWIRHHHG